VSTISPTAVIATGGKQYKVKAGQKFKFEKLPGEVGQTIEFDQVLMLINGNDVQIGAPRLDCKVTATILEQGRGKKIDVIKFKRRKKYRRKQGHRQSFTEVEITGISA